MDTIEQSLNVFFNEDLHVAVIKGDWGVGKTRFWDDYIKGKTSDNTLKQVAYCYISLFGKSNLSDIKQSLFQSSKPIKADSAINESFDKSFEEESKIYNLLPWVRGITKQTKNNIPLLEYFTKHIKHTPILNQYTSLISSLEYSMVNNYVVCIDDIERKADSLPIKLVMGLVDEIAQRKSCKVMQSHSYFQ